MAEPTTPNIALISPNTGDLPGAWGTAAINVNNSAIDGLLGGTQTITLSSATTIALTLPAGGFTPGAGPNQSQNACLFFTGTMTGNAVIQFAMPGKYVVHNKTTGNNSFYIQLAPSAGTGNAIGAPPGKKCSVFYDGTNVDYLDQPDVGTAYDLHNAATYPPWMNACTALPYLIKDGSIYTSSIYPALNERLGSTFGGNGVSTFGVPDERNRMRMPVDTNTNGGFTNRITLVSCGISGTTMGAAGGDQRLAAHTHVASVTDPGHTHAGPNIVVRSVGNGSASENLGGGPDGATNLDGTVTGGALTGISVAIAASGAGSSNNVQPSIVSFLALIKT
jgi:microcystin-dependent protein